MAKPGKTLVNTPRKGKAVGEKTCFRLPGVQFPAQSPKTTSTERHPRDHLMDLAAPYRLLLPYGGTASPKSINHAVCSRIKTHQQVWRTHPMPIKLAKLGTTWYGRFGHLWLAIPCSQDELGGGGGWGREVYTKKQNRGNQWIKVEQVEEQPNSW